MLGEFVRVISLSKHGPYPENSSEILIGRIGKVSAEDEYQGEPVVEIDGALELIKWYWFLRCDVEIVTEEDYIEQQLIDRLEG